MSRIAVLAATAAAAGALLTADAPQPAKVDTISVVLQRKAVSGVWEDIDPQLVLQHDDSIRFRFQASFQSHVYVWNHASDGKVELLYPRPDSASATFQPGAWYLIPGDQGLFTVGGPPGFDVTYWVASPNPLSPAPAAPSAPAFPNTIRPKCQEEVLRSKGACNDENAGARPARMDDLFWRSLGGTMPELRSRELRFSTQDAPTRISASGRAGYLLYEFRIAHQ
jgi:hypothetical protein